MVVVGRIRKGAYFDSVTLMNVARELSRMEGVADAAVVMGTAENRAILAGADLLTPDFRSSSDTDLLIGIRAESDDAAAAALAAVDGFLESVRAVADDGEAFTPRSLESALDLMPDANLALISVAGRYAGAVASRALDLGLNVMLFSDNVAVETERELKIRAHGLGLLVMGPDCGTAIINGVPLGFANAVNRGPIGIVAASGTGLQEVSTLISNHGSGVSQAIGTGGRDVKSAVGGVTFLDGLKALGDDPGTEVVVLISKPPDPDVLAAIRDEAGRIGKPVVSVFLGAEPEGTRDARTLAEAAEKALALVSGSDLAEFPGHGQLLGDDVRELAREIASARTGAQKHLRALMSGGTFAVETQIVLADLGVTGVRSNVQGGNAADLEDPLTSVANTVVDLGADEFTVGRPHPMIDYALRVKRIEQEAHDPSVAVIILDVVLGYGANMDPAGELADVIRDAASRVAVICSVTGTEGDPQGKGRTADALRAAGAVIMPSNAAASALAAGVVLTLGGA